MGSSPQPYHPGELSVQRRAGQRVVAIASGRAIADRLRPGALAFVEQQTLLLVGSVDGRAHPWASVLVGPPGFVRGSDERTLRVDLGSGRASADDPVWANVRAGSQVGLLFLELRTRRRLRVNGRVESARPDAWQLSVQQAYPNCPKYIALHELGEHDPGAARAASLRGRTLTERQRDLLRSTEAFFVASAHPEHGVDVSHRGGPPGFVEVDDRGQLHVPDYPGNGMFNTLGNLECNPCAGLACIDTARGRVLQLSGSARLCWGRPGGDEASGRSWRLLPTRWIETSLPVRPATGAC